MEQMDLLHFVRTTLVQIVEGVSTASKQLWLQGSGAVVNPRDPRYLITEPRDVEFDVALTVTNSTDLDGEARIKIASFAVGGGGGKSTQNQAVSRVRFAIPVSFPSTAHAAATPQTTSEETERQQDLASVAKSV
jgi:hypothetical protein